MLKKVFFLFLLPFAVLLSIASENPRLKPGVPSPFDRKATHWVDSSFASLSEEERLGQLFMVAAYSNQSEASYRQIDSLIVNYNIGGLIFFQGGPVRQAQLNNRYQSLSKVPLFVSMDAEWGLGMRLDSTISYPKQMTLGAIQDNQYVYKMGAEIARQFKRIGMHINFAPVIDVNSNPDNPIIGNRSFGETKENVAEKGDAYMRGLQRNGIIASAKHFPGHGDTDSDSHLTLPVINHSVQRLDQIELYPFKRLIADSLMSMMVGHLYIPAYDKKKNVATTLSSNVVTKLLKNNLGFKGLVFTDALNMKGVSKFYKPGEVDVLALLAGNDVLLFSENVPEAIRRIKKAIKQRQISQNEVDDKVRRILRAKFWAKINENKIVDINGLYKDLNSPKAEQVKYELYEQAMTLVQNKEKLIPFTHLDTTSFASVAIGIDSANVFQAMLSNYAPFENYNIGSKTSDDNFDKVYEKVKNFDVVVVSLHKLSDSKAKRYGITQNALDFIEKLQARRIKVVVNVFGNPYSLKHFDKTDYLLCAYEDNSITHQIIPQVLFGAIPAMGKLPVSADNTFRQGVGLQTVALGRLRYGIPESVGLSSESLSGIDKIAEQAILSKAMPGAQILVARKGKVIFNRSYGFQTYDSLQPVTPQTIYDIASVTKVTATLQTIMFLQERGLLDLNQKASFYLPELMGTNKQEMLVRDILMHQAGLTAYIPYWERTRVKGGLNPQYYTRVPDEIFSKEVAQGLYTMPSIKDSVWKWTINSSLIFKGKKEKEYPYVYSDLGYYFMQRIAEKLLNQPLNEFVEQNFYAPLGLGVTTFNPLCKFPNDRIAPTENDKLFRRIQVRGTVHDQGAALMGGVAGHAGLFSNANDLAILMQMNLQRGYYGGQRYLMPNTLPTFVKSYNEGNRRGLGWDRPIPGGGGYISDFASRNSFGHSGFTGTLVWVDPNEDLVYVFLSNRVYPDAENTRLIKQATRRKVQDVIYKSIINYDVLSASTEVSQ